MSYILDALKKADADRERDAAGVPDLHAQADAAYGALRRSRPGRGLLWAAVGSITIAVLAWQWLDAAPTDLTSAVQCVASGTGTGTGTGADAHGPVPAAAGDVEPARTAARTPARRSARHCCANRPARGGPRPGTATLIGGQAGTNTAPTCA